MSIYTPSNAPALFRPPGTVKPYQQVLNLWAGVTDPMNYEGRRAIEFYRTKEQVADAPPEGFMPVTIRIVDGKLTLRKLPLVLAVMVTETFDV